MIDLFGFARPLAGERLRPLGHPSGAEKRRISRRFAWGRQPEPTRVDVNTPRTDSKNKGRIKGRVAWPFFAGLFRRLWPDEAEHDQPAFVYGRKERKRDAEEQGLWYDLGDLLKHLDLYFELLVHMRRSDPDGYVMYRRVGGIVGCPNALYEHATLPASWRHGSPPTFGASMLWPELAAEGEISFAFGYFRKFEALPHVQALPHTTIYQVTLVYAKEGLGPTNTAFVSFHVAVDRMGDVTVLRENVSGQETLSYNSRKTIPKRAWQYPSALRWLWRSKQIRREEFPTIQDYGSWVFRVLVQGWDQASGGILVRVKRGGVAACFCIDMLRTPYFFRDRDLVVDQSGRRKKIIHIVRTHERRLGHNRRTFVRSHFRGMRQFRWHDYDVSVSMPGWHHNDFRNLTTSGIYDDGTPQIKKTISWHRFIGEIGRLFDEGWRGNPRRKGKGIR
jgi:hypothetical protein